MALIVSACSAAGIDSGKPNLGSDNPGNLRDNTPVVLLAEQPGYMVAQDSSAIIDYSNSSQGYISAMTMTDGLFKVLIDAPDGTRYQFSLRSPNRFITIPLSAGNGEYSVGFFKNVSDNRYAPMFSVQISVNLVDQNLPFLYPNQYVDFEVNDRAVLLSQEITKGATSEIEAIDAIYLWCVMNLSYDYKKASEVQPGYLPDNDNTLDTLNGICFDYAVLCASMMRAQRLPTRLEIGFCGSEYHAWISVYTTEQGVIRREINFNPDSWTLLDPTIDSSGRTPLGLGPLIVDPKDYQPLLFY
ncbi:MAG: transglutaminase-like domain-containing protein [Coriobacteriia bacterium]|nr:transglutaminase-like domain-containing protein [Coriobacteriia bacterium]